MPGGAGGPMRDYLQIELEKIIQQENSKKEDDEGQ